MVILVIKVQYIYAHIFLYGTEATRAGIITMLKDRKYIDVKKNQVYATDKGKVLITAIGDKILASPEMTAKWEQRLAEIGEGTASPATFMEQTKSYQLKLLKMQWKCLRSGISLDYMLNRLNEKDRNLQRVKRLVAVKM